MTKFPIGEAINKPMNVTAKKLKDGYTHAFVGFPVTSLGKYVPNDGSVTFVPVSDEQIDVTLNVDFGDATIEDVRAQATHQRGTQRRGISRRIHQTLEDVCITSYIGTDRKENRHHGFHKAKDGCEKCQFISWNFPTYRLLQNQEEHIHAA